MQCSSIWIANAATGMIAVTYILRRYNRELQTSEMFNTAGRTVKSGLVASAVVSSWTWAATLLQSTGVCYRYGVSGPFWYASGATVQILLFATLAIELKRRAPNAHTYLEIIKARYGTFAHIVFLVFGLATNILVSLMLIVGGSATVNALTGMHTIAASKFPLNPGDVHVDGRGWLTRYTKFTFFLLVSLLTRSWADSKPPS
jgi:Na+/proline symporter